MRTAKLGIIVVAALVGLSYVGAVKIKPISEEAFVTLLYGDEFLLGVRVLGKSLRDTGSTKDMVVLVSDGVSHNAIDQLKADGWIVEMISLLQNPNHVRPKRFWGVYTKLKIFNMTEYKKVVYLDADTIVVKNIDNLFKCGKFCANLKHSERLNSGVMVVQPSQTLFNDMMSKVTTLPSYTGGDQGFLNSYYSDFPNAHVFQPNNPRNPESSPAMERLSTLYNADVGLYMLANKWMVDERELHVIHYTLGPLKPWDWWTSWIVKPVDVWQNVRFKLDATLPGTGGGANPKDALIVKFLFIFPFLCVLILYYRNYPQHCRVSISDQGRLLLTKIQSLFLHTYSPVSSASTSPHTLHSSAMAKFPTALGAISVIICLSSAFIAIALSFLLIPRQVAPWTGLLLMYEWTFTLFSLVFGSFLHFAYSRGKLAALVLPDYDKEKGYQKLHDATWRYWIGMGCLAVSVPCFPFVLGITALFAKVGSMAIGGLFLASFMVYASEHLALRYFLKGFSDDSKRSRNGCFMC